MIILPPQRNLHPEAVEPAPGFGRRAQRDPWSLCSDLVFFAESTVTHDSSSDPGRVIASGEVHFPMHYFPKGNSPK
jgi:hypothetical protein